jgi:ArsR family transcriptional regulator, arsenate/arsenite/antimonite-responsive transcriptional repressor
MINDLVFKALADPTRRRVLRLLRDREMTAGQLVEQFDISASSMSHHFNVLKQADLISSRREGQQIYYSLNTTVVQDLMSALLEVFLSDEERERSLS